LEKKFVPIAELQWGQAHFNNRLESVEEEDSSVSNETGAITPRQDAMNWFAACGYSFI
jgi:hypothetical protein